ncbi:type II secretion system minor pseudopilin GspH [Thalassolituus marinus]|uniref:Type II secretion system protein H n=1 Tax=Thalassolituus marinus TaxID=671053 RepID=A0ABS7ZQX7_9GAMM|nr:type II secretion system minor pseudopilin GspH [Thalassolituus marinus]MCA6064121.1 type II secretion system minor pseudopilin GspH [Thalassolituus marinus]
MKHSRAFTLLEVLVVLAVIGGLMALVTINGSDRQAQDETEQFARRLLAIFDSARQEAVFQNVDLGMAMDQQSLLLLSYQDIHSQEFTANKSREELDKLAKNPWQTYSTGPLRSDIDAPEHVYMALKVDGQAIDYSDFLDGDEGPRPALLFLSSDEYTPYELTLASDLDERFSLVVRGDGFNSPLLTVERFGE